MNNKRVLRLIALLLAAVMAAAVMAGCAGGNNDNNNGGDEADATEQTAVVVTESPDGEITASPTLEPGATESAVNTEAAQPGGTEGSTPAPGATETTPDVTPAPGTTDGPVATGGAAITTIEPVVPSETARPTAFVFPTAGATPTPTPRPTPRPTSSPTGTPLPNNSFEAHYGGATVEEYGLAVGGTFYWTLDLLNEHSRLWSGHWLVDYPEDYLEVDSYSTSWSGGITAITNATWDDETDWSDKPAFVCNPDYMGNTGGHPKGEEGNMYANCGMYLTTFHHYGVQMAGSMIRIKFKLKATPPDSALKHDSGGYYIEIPILVCESTAMIDAPADSSVQPYSCTPHGTVTVVPGKVYIRR